MRGLSTRLTAFSVSSPALTARLSTLESVKRSRKTVAALRPAFRRRAFHDSMRSTVMAVSGSGYPRFFRCKRPDFPQYYSAIASEPCVVRSHAARLYPQREAGQSTIVDLERFALRLGLFAREQRRSDEGLHDESPRMGSGKPGPDGPRLSARRNPGVAYTFEGQPHPSLARRPSH